MTEAPITTTLKAPGANSPWVVIRSENTAQLNAQLSEIQANGIFAVLAGANEAFAAHFTVGGILGAKPLNAPVDTGAFAPAPVEVPAPAAAVDAGAAALQQQIAALQAQQANANFAATPPTPTNGATPGAPIIAGMPAKLVSGSSARGPWQAWADPRPKEATDHMQKTDDVNHPGLNGGTHRLWRFIR